MTPQQKFQTRLRLIDLVAEYVTATCGESLPDEGQNPLLELLSIYREDTVRRSRGEQGSLDFLWERLKVGVRLAGTLMEEIQDSPQDRPLLGGWFYSCQPANMVQRLYSLLYETSLELSWSIMAIESQYPEMKRLFDAERDAYRSQCLKELEAAQQNG